MEHPLFERILGSRPPDVGDSAGWVEYVGWSDVDLYLGFSRAAYEEHDIPRLVGWQSSGSPVELELRTPGGVGVGATIADLRVIYGDEFVVPTEPDVCAGLTVHLLGPDRGIWADIHEDTGVVKRLGAGLQVGC